MKKKINVLLVIGIIISIIIGLIIKVKAVSGPSLVVFQYSDGMQHDPTGYKDLNGSTDIHLSANTIFSYEDNPSIYCIQAGSNVANYEKYEVKLYRTVTDPILAYILSLDDNIGAEGYCAVDNDHIVIDRHHGTKNNTKQRLLWAYIAEYNTTSTDLLYLKSLNDNIDLKGLDKSKSLRDIDESYWTKAQQATVGNTVTNINSIISGENIITTWSSLATEFKIEISDNQDNNYKECTDYNIQRTGDIYSVSIPLSIFKTEFPNISTAYVRVSPKELQCSAGFYCLINGYYQNVIAIHGSRTDGYGTASIGTVVLNTNVSLQKYIIKAGDITVNNRVNSYAVDTNNNLTSGNYNHYDKNISNHEGKEGVKSGSFIKQQTPVQIEPGEEVTYRIEVYNNSSIASIVTVADDFSAGGRPVITKVKTLFKGTSYDVYNNNGSIPQISRELDNTRDYDIVFWYDSDNNNYKYKFKLDVQNQAGSKMYIDVTMKYNEYTGDLLRNRAWIFETDPNNSTEYRNIDADYIKMKEYKVSLEKFVSQVTDKDGNNSEIYTSERQGKRYNDSASTVENKNTYKPNNKVGLEVGDIVTYTIRLENTGDTDVKITQIYDSFDTKSNGVKLEYVSTYGIKGNGTSGGRIVNFNYRGPGNTWSTNNLTRYLIQFDNAIILKPGNTTNLTMQFKVIVPSLLTNQSHVLDNKACIVELRNKYNINVNDGDGTDNNRDQDYVITKIYAVSLEKFVYKVNDYEMCDFDKNGSVDNTDAILIRNYSSQLEISNEEKDRIIKYGDINNDGKITIADSIFLIRAINNLGNEKYSRDGYAEHNYDDNTATNNNWKHNNVVTVSQGDKVTYKINLKNDGETSVYITEVTDFLPDGVKYGDVTYSRGQYDTTTDNAVIFNGTRINGNIIIAPGETVSFEVSVTVTESNMSLNVLKNTARITEMKNRNINVVNDTTLNNNEDADYLKLNHQNPPTPPPTDDDNPKQPTDVILAGMVWNDINPLKNNSEEGYNGLYRGNEGSDDNERKLAGVKVYLYRNGVNTAIATKTTDERGYYYFADIDIDKDVVTDPKERHIKGPIDSESNRWEGTYYSYYIVFEYDGITYTATPNGNTCVSVTDNTAYNNGTYKINSNAREDFGKAEESRSSFNNKYSTINNESAIEYKTLNENEYMPQSIHKYNSDMAMQSSTALIQLSNNSILEEEIKYINLGLRGRDTFDLELHSDVYSTRVTVNGQQGEYKYNSNRVNVRKSDMTVEEDVANSAKESRTGTVSDVEQKVRESDIDVTKTDNSKRVTVYSSTGLGIEVTYKITVANISNTDGTATKIVNYYDNSYKFERAYCINGTLSAQSLDSGNGFNSVVITTQGTNLSKNVTMDIYVVYTMKEPINTLRPLLTGTNMIPTFNMSEIYEYKTQCASGQTEYTRGLIDINSAPGSANREQVRTTNTVVIDTPITGGNPTTVQYYFNKKSNSNTDLSILKYEDDTYASPTLYFTTDGGRKIEGQVFEDKTQVNSERVRSGNGIKDSDENGIYGVTVILKEGNVERYKTISDENGNYSFEDFLPGNYTIEYRYGDTKKTVLQKQSGNVNAKSYNGEDYQSTNNAYDVKDIIVNKLNKTPNFWYVFNESKKVSVADDVETRRNVVSNNVSNFTESEMINLNDIRSGKTVSDEVYNNIKNKTHMNALTNNFTLTVEKSIIDGNTVKQNNSYADYVVSGMNFGLAEVPVTTINLQKHISQFTIKDSARENVIASYDGTNKVGDVLPLDNIYDVSIEDEKLQGAKLEITFNVSAKTITEVDFRNSNSTKVTIDGIVDFIDNDLLYNDALGENSKYWKVSSYAEIQEEYNKIEALNGERAKGSVDPEGTSHTTIVIAKEGNPLLEYHEGTELICPITLEKVLSASNASLNDIITSSIVSYEYSNDVEILKLNYSNTIQGLDRIPLRDRVRDESRMFTILAGTQYDSASSEVLAIHPPTGKNNNINYYIIGASALAILAVGVVLIKKYAIKKD